MTNQEKEAIGIPEDKQGQIRSWPEMLTFLSPLHLDESTLRLAEEYFKGQNLVAEGNIKDAVRLFDALSKDKKYQKFEDENRFLLITIDIGVKNKTGWTEN